MLAPTLLALVLATTPADTSAIIKAALDRYVEKKCGSSWMSLPTLVSDASIAPYLGSALNARSIIPEELVRRLAAMPAGSWLELPHPLTFPFRAATPGESDRLRRPWDRDMLLELNAAGGILRFSVPVLDKSGNSAAIYMAHSCGNLCAEGSLLYLRKRPFGWVVIREIPLWVS